jgi:hypothetical protein
MSTFSDGIEQMNTLSYATWEKSTLTDEIG